jgi:RNA recognition motif-containing protein
METFTDSPSKMTMERRRNGKNRESGVAPIVRVTIDGLPESFADEDLKALFSPYGPVLTAAVIDAAHILSYRYGVVELGTVEQAKQARAALNRTFRPRAFNLGVYLDERKREQRRHRPRGQLCLELRHV